MLSDMNESLLALQQLAVSCPTLTILDVSGCLQVDDAGLNPLITKCGISSLSIAGCPDQP